MSVNAKLINWGELFERCMNDEEFAGQMLDVFIDNAPKTLASLKESLAANQANDSRRHAHTLKGSAGNLAIEALRAISYTAEKLAADGKLADVAPLVSQLEQLLTASIAEASSIKLQLLSKAA